MFFSDLRIGFRNLSGRGGLGRLTLFHRGGSKVKRKYRLLDLRRNLYNIRGFVMTVEYDPNRSSFISLVCYETGILSYILSFTGAHFGSPVLSTTVRPKRFFEGLSLRLAFCPMGRTIYGVCTHGTNRPKIARSAGTLCAIIRNIGRYAVLKLPSGAHYLVKANSFCTIGSVSNKRRRFIKIGKAGRARRLNFRPIVRGVAMNPVDHPHGGGEGKSSGGRSSSTPWGFYTKGSKTRRLHRKCVSLIVLDRRLRGLRGRRK